MKNNKRLNIIKDKIENIKKSLGRKPSVVDVGCDHGILGKMLIESGLVSKLVESDISEKCLEKAKNLLQDKSVDVSFRVGDGLGVIEKGEMFDVAVIAGMGGREITKIINNKVKVSQIRFLVLQTSQDDMEIVSCVQSHMFGVDFDFLLEAEGKLYRTIVVDTKVRRKFDEKYRFYGKDNCGNNDAFEIEKRRLKFVREKILLGVHDKNCLSEQTKTKISEIDERLSCLKNTFL